MKARTDSDEADSIPTANMDSSYDSAAVEDMDTAYGYSIVFRKYLKKGRISAAAKTLAALKIIRSDYEGIDFMKMDLSFAIAELSSRRNEIFAVYSNRMHFKVKELTEKLIARYPEALSEDHNLSQLYNDSVSACVQAEQYCARAKVEPKKNDRMKLYFEAVELCRDCSTALLKLKECPPIGPGVGQFYVDNGHVHIMLDDYPDPSNTTYCIYKSRIVKPVITEGVVPSDEIPASATEYIDADLELDAGYYYTIYTKRFGALSRECIHFGPVIIGISAPRFTITEMFGGFRIICERLSANHKIFVWRSLATGSSKRIELKLSNVGCEWVCEDYVPGGRAYVYTIVAQYTLDGQTNWSDPVSKTVDAPKIPIPIDNMEVRWNSADDTFTARWKSERRPVLYYALKEIPTECSKLKMEDLNAWATPVEVVDGLEDGIVFRLPEFPIVYVYPIILVGGLALKGRASTVCISKPFTDVEYSCSGDDCILTMHWPDGASHAKIVVSEDIDASGHDGEEAYIVKYERYVEEGQIRIRMRHRPRLYLCICAVYSLGNQELSSEGVSLMVSSGVSGASHPAVPQEVESPDDDAPSKVPRMDISVGIPVEVSISGKDEITLCHLKICNRDSDTGIIVSMYIDDVEEHVHSGFLKEGETKTFNISTSVKKYRSADAADRDVEVVVKTLRGDTIRRDSKTVHFRTIFDIESQRMKQDIAIWVTSNANEVKELLTPGHAVMNALIRNGYPSVTGYQVGNSKDSSELLNRVRKQMGGVYDGLCSLGIKYVSDTDSTGNNLRYDFQRIKHPKDVLKDRTGNCIELSCLFAAIFECMGFHPVILFPPGHAIVGVIVSSKSEWLREVYGHSYSSRAGVVDLRMKDRGDGHSDSLQVLAIETTCICSGMAFSQAEKSALETLKKSMGVIASGEKFAVIPYQRRFFNKAPVNY